MCYVAGSSVFSCNQALQYGHHFALGSSIWEKVKFLILFLSICFGMYIVSFQKLTGNFFALIGGSTD